MDLKGTAETLQSAVWGTYRHQYFHAGIEEIATTTVHSGMDAEGEPFVRLGLPLSGSFKHFTDRRC